MFEGLCSDASGRIVGVGREHTFHPSFFISYHFIGLNVSLSDRALLKAFSIS